MQSKLRVGTRKSDLALTQTNLVKNTLESKGYAPEIQHIITVGDKDLRPFQHMTGDGFFTKEIEKNLLAENINLAVHSSKDLPSQIHKSLPWVAYSEREETADIIIVKKEFVLSENPLKLKNGILIGTSSPRRTAQLKKAFPTARIESIRGNVPTRIEKVLSGEFEATVLAKAGVNRLNLQQSILEKGLMIIELGFVTAPCQGILGVQGHEKHKRVLDQIKNKDLTDIAMAEKSVLAMLGGGCQLAVGCKITKDKSYYMDFFFSEDGKNTELKLKAHSLEGLLRDLFAKISESRDSGQRVISTQPLQHQLRTAKKLAKNNFYPIPWVMREVLPTFSHEDFKNIHDGFASFDALVFTSQFSVRIFMNEFISQYPEHLDAVKKLKLYAVGDATKSELLAYEMTNIIVPEDSHGEALLEILDAQNPLLMGSTDSLLMKVAEKQGRNYKFLKLYGSFVCQNPLSRLPALKDNDKLVLTNPLCAKDFVELHKGNPTQFQHIKIYAFGPSTSKILLENNIEHTVNKKSGSWDEMINTLR
ncbi:MAG: hydroxymethylbilane synthase [Bdellovibrionota bacterium]